jgi:hypothetical protein
MIWYSSKSEEKKNKQEKNESRARTQRKLSTIIYIRMNVYISDRQHGHIFLSFEDPVLNIEQDFDFLLHHYSLFMMNNLTMNDKQRS